MIDLTWTSRMAAFDDGIELKLPVAALDLHVSHWPHG